MIIYKYGMVQVSNHKGLQRVQCEQTEGTPGIYTLCDVEPNSFYHIIVNHGHYDGDAQLWILDEKNKVMEFSPKFKLSSRWRALEYCLNVKNNKKLKIGVLFNKPTLNDYFEIRSIDIQKVNVPHPLRKRLAIVVPYRNRLEHMKEFIPHMSKYLKQFDSQIFIIHQCNEKSFNRAALMNIGFDIVKKEFDYFCFHDVDLLPEAADYSVPDRPAHLSMYCSQFDYKRKSIFGGVVLFTKEQFSMVDGFSNLYKGWGGEDDDLRLRVRQHYIPLYRPGIYTSLPHKHAGATHENYKQNYNLLMDRTKDPKLLKRDGISAMQKSFKYKILEINRLDKKCNMTKVPEIEYKNKLNYMINVDF